MDGIADGVAYYNKQKGKHVKVLGWNPSTQKGTFVGNFSDQNKAKTYTTNFLNQDADVIIPVAGALYQGGGAAIKSSGKKAVLEGVDADLVQTDTAGYKSLFLVSILKNIQVVTNAVVTQAAKGGTFDNSQYVGNLKNNGVGLSSFHDYASKVPSGLDGEITKLELRGVTKRFGALVANDRIDLVVSPGEIHCLLGENGAGKSTLMNVLYGLLQPDEGEITVDGRRQVSRSPKDAIAAGIGMVHQHFMLVDVFTVAENLALGRETRGLLNMRQARATVRELSSRYRLEVDPDALVEDLPVGVQQRVEILKALANDARYLIFDEPTAVLTPQEIDELMVVMRSLRDEGKAVVFITHKLREVREIADTITVIRRGAVVGTADPNEPEGRLAELMVGRAVNLVVDKQAARPSAEPRLRLRGVSVANAAGHVVVEDLDLDVHGGEIVCVAGVQGNGQSELADALLGTLPVSAGSIILDGTTISGRTPKEIIDA